VGVRAATCHGDECGQQHTSHACWARSNMWVLTASVHDVRQWENCCKDNERSDKRWPQLIKSAAGTVSRRSRSFMLVVNTGSRCSTFTHRATADVLLPRLKLTASALIAGTSALSTRYGISGPDRPSVVTSTTARHRGVQRRWSESEFLNSNVHTPHPHLNKPHNNANFISVVSKKMRLSVRASRVPRLYGRGNEWRAQARSTQSVSRPHKRQHSILTDCDQYSARTGLLRSPKVH
jgi:hypothetical protein